ncbi:Predicted transcriptional regulator [Salmonella enterica subsp. enterica]|uniref:Predicted transcriptional regulator n=1 Tax=Salmonella enterica I TaxID=59201 RepID=A0A379W6F2_SALET|nr:Predicted transcriptional regulator [Salmonella enterica subsp. enterica]
MKGALGKKELLAVVPLSMSTIDRLESAGEFPKRWYITDKRCAWTQEELNTGWKKEKRQVLKNSKEKSRRLISEFTAQ